jgi:hypothetical protein
MRFIAPSQLATLKSPLLLLKPLKGKFLKTSTQKTIEKSALISHLLLDAEKPLD